MLTPVASLFWFSEIILEAICCRYAFRRRFVPFWLYFGFRALADAICMAILQFGTQGVYAWADLIQRTVQYLLFWAVAIYISCGLFSEDRYAIRTYTGMFSILGIAAIVYFHAQPLTMARLHNFELGAQGAAAVFVAAAFFGLSLEKRSAPAMIWKWSGYALLVKAVWDILTTGLIVHGHHVEHWYPFGALAALGMWACAFSGVRQCRTYGLKRKEAGELSLRLG